MCRLNKAEGCYKLLNIPVFFFCFLSCKICMLKKNSKLKYIKSRLNPRLSPDTPPRDTGFVCVSCLILNSQFDIYKFTNSVFFFLPTGQYFHSLLSRRLPIGYFVSRIRALDAWSKCSTCLLTPRSTGIEILWVV